MAARTMAAFLNYFGKFEECVAGQRNFTELEPLFTPDATYSVTGAPFACEIMGAANITTALQRSVENFDKKMESRGLEILSCIRESPTRIRVQLVSSYGARGAGVAVAPVSMCVNSDNGRISHLEDLYDPTLSAPALMWLAENAGDADPSYV